MRTATRNRLEFDQKIRVAVLRIEVGSQDGAENRQPTHLILPAKAGDGIKIRLNKILHNNSEQNRTG